MSGLPFELLLVLRYLRPKRTFVSIITLISIIGVTLGVAVLIIVISVMTGFDHQLRERILGFSSHLRITKHGTVMKDYLTVMGLVRADPQVRGTAPLVMGQVLVETQPENGESLVAAPWVRGIDPAREREVSVLADRLIDGTFSVMDNGVLIGRDFAREMNLVVGDRLGIYSPRNLKQLRASRERGAEAELVQDEFVVTGIFDVGYYEFNMSVIVCSLENGQDLYDLNDAVHGLLVMLDDPLQAQAVRKRLMAVLGPSYTIRTWTEENSTILNALVVEKNVMFYILFFIVIVAAFGITSALITFVVQKTREIGILKSLGAGRGQIMLIFLGQSLVVGVLGVCTGLALGRLAIAYRNEFLHLMNRLTGFELFPPEIYNFTELPALIVGGDIAIICGGSLLICLLAGLIPAWIAGRLKPVDALRYE
jgi:lipoprotein-releasing system permease protein